MTRGIFSKPSEQEAAALQKAAEILAASRSEIISSWMKSYQLVDIAGALSPRAFNELCCREFDRLVERLTEREFDRYWAEVGELTHELLGRGLSTEALAGIIHYFEESCTRALMPRADTTLLLALATFLHNALTLVLTTVVDTKSSSLTEQLSFGRAVEAAFRPKPPPRLPGVDLGVLFAPAPGLFELGGDFYDFFLLPDDRIAFSLGDVSGRGIEAAADAAMTKFMLRSFAAEHTLPGRVLERTNQALSYFLHADEFVTAVCGSYHPDSGKIVIASAGHPRPIYMPADGAPTLIEQAGPALGVLPNITCPDWEKTLDPDDLVFMYTDGLLEARVGPELFGEARIIDVLSRHPRDSAQHRVDAVNEACLGFCEGTLSDDMAVLALRVVSK